MAKLTQCDRILRHMRDFGSIDPVTAFLDYGCMRLAARIADLKDQGYAITSTVTHGKNRYDEPVVYSTYRLAE